MSSTTSSSYLRSLCSTVQLPHLEAQRDDNDLHPDVMRSFSGRQNYSINVFPQRAALARAMVDFVRCQRWTSVALLYVDDDGQ